MTGIIFNQFVILLSKHFEDFLLDISKIAEDLKKIMKESVERLNLKSIDTFVNRDYNIDDDNQFSFMTIGPIETYLIAHKDVSVIYDFLQLSPSTIQNIERTRQFITNLIPETFYIPTTFNKIKIRSDEQIELTITGYGLTGFNIVFTDGVVSVTTPHTKSHSYHVECYEALDFIINTAANQIIPSFLKVIGFDSEDEHSPEVVRFIKKTPEELFLEKKNHHLFNYVKPDDLMRLVCDDLKLNSNDVMNSLNYMEADSFLNLYIPNNLTSMMSSIAHHVIKIDGIKPKLDQLFSLAVLYNYIFNKRTKCSVTFTPIQKSDFFKGADFNRAFYSLHVGDTLTIKIGYNLLKKDKDKHAYVDDNNDTKFLNFVYFKDLKTYDYKEYFTNDIDFVYNDILTELQNMIKQVIHKDDNLISFKDLEVYKMAVV